MKVDFFSFLTFGLDKVPWMAMRGSERKLSSPLTCPQPRFKESSSSVWSASENSPGIGIKHIHPRVCLVLFMFHFSIVCKGDFFGNAWLQDVSSIHTALTET